MSVFGKLSIIVLLGGCGLGGAYAYQASVDPTLLGTMPFLQRAAKLKEVIAIFADGTGGRKIEAALRNTSAPPKPSAPQISRDEIVALLERDARHRDVTAKIALGDVVTIDADGQEVAGEYRKLVEAGVLQFRLCRFPGAGPQGPREICLVELSKQACALASPADGAPIKTIEAPALGDKQPANRVYARVAIARGAVALSDQPIERVSPAARRVQYEQKFALTALAKTLAIDETALPPARTRIAEIAWTNGRWSVASDGPLQRPRAQAAALPPAR